MTFNHTSNTREPLIETILTPRYSYMLNVSVSTVLLATAQTCPQHAFV